MVLKPRFWESKFSEQIFLKIGSLFRATRRTPAHSSQYQFVQSVFEPSSKGIKLEVLIKGVDGEHFKREIDPRADYYSVKKKGKQIIIGKISYSYPTKLEAAEQLGDVREDQIIMIQRHQDLPFTRFFNY